MRGIDVKQRDKLADFGVGFSIVWLAGSLVTPFFGTEQVTFFRSLGGTVLGGVLLLTAMSLVNDIRDD